MFVTAGSYVDAFLISASMDMTATVSSNAALEQKKELPLLLIPVIHF